MPNEYDNERRFTLFRVREKRNPNSPDYTGNLEINGVKYRLSAWARKAKSDGATYLSGMVSDQEAKDERAETRYVRRDEPVRDFKPRAELDDKSSRPALKAVAKAEPDDFSEDGIPF